VLYLSQALASVLRGHYAYYAVPDNSEALSVFRLEVTKHWRRSLPRRSQRSRLTWKRMDRLVSLWLQPVRILHPWPDARFYAKTQGRSPVR
jgi:RNA-directed DNA polymerase